MSDQNTPPADETAPIAGRRTPPRSTPDPVPAPSEPPPDAAYDAPPADERSADGGQGATPKRPWRERLRRGTATGGSRTFGVGALVAGTLAGLIVGGFGGAAIVAAVGDDHDRGERYGHPERGIPGDRDDDLRGDRGPFGQLPPPGAVPVPPTDAPETTPPTEDEDEDGGSDGSGSSSS